MADRILSEFNFVDYSYLLIGAGDALFLGMFQFLAEMFQVI